MRDVRIRFNGDGDTRLVLTEQVKGKRLLKQKYLINTATSKNTDPIFPDRGTDLLTRAIAGGAVNQVTLMHMGNFAATDTLYFCSYEEHKDVFTSNSYIREYTLTPKIYNNQTHTLSFQAGFVFKDGTTAGKELSISSLS